MIRKLLQPTELYEEASRRMEELEKILCEKELELERAPLGDISIVKKRGCIQYYYRRNSNEKCGTYFSKNKKKEISALLQKKYDKEVVNLLKKEIKVINSFIIRSKISEKIFSKSIQDIFTKFPEESQLLIKPIDINNEELIKGWVNIPYEKKEISDDITIYLTDRGERVRSKSELNIANILYKHNIPYKYEHPLKLKNGHVIYPDFTCKR